MNKLFVRARIVILLTLLLAFSSIVLAQADEAEAKVDMTAVIVGAFVTVAVMALGAVWAAVQSGKSVGDATRAGSESAVRGIIQSKPIAQWGEERLNYVPASIRRALEAVIDVYDPISARTESDLDNKTQQWLRNLLDGDPNTGAVSSDEDPF